MSSALTSFPAQLLKQKVGLLYKNSLQNRKKTCQSAKKTITCDVQLAASDAMWWQGSPGNLVVYGLPGPIGSFQYRFCFCIMYSIIS